METDHLLKKDRGSRDEKESEETEDSETEIYGQRDWKYRACSAAVIVSCFFVLCTQGIEFTFGNMNPYLTSYLRNASQDDVEYTDTLWIAQTMSVTSCAVQPLAGVFANRVPVRLFLFLGALFQAAFLFGSYWAVRTSFWAILLTYGVIGGVPSAFFYATCLRVSAAWLPEKKGLVMGGILMGYGIGAFMWNGLTTWYINRDNLQPDLKVGVDVYYTQNAVLDKVPSCFLMLGTVFASAQLFFLLFIRMPPASRARVQRVVAINQAQVQRVVAINQARVQRVVAINQAQDDMPSAKEDSQCLPGSNSDAFAGEGREKPDYKLKQTIKTRVFWTLWAMMFFSTLGTSFVIALFKAYGQTFIADDHFLASVAMASSVCNAVGRPVWGLLADRFGARMVSLVCQSLLTILVATFTSCHVTGRYAFLLWVCAMFLTMCSFFTMLPVMVLAAFGSRNFNANMGMVSTYGTVGSVLPALIASPLKDAFGWNGLFFFAFVGLFTGIVLNMSLDWCQCGDSIPRHMLDDLSIRRKR
ncbi:oxalate:formate antiporter-like isoform X2 [Littorina saxatilis]|uniref:oxalate:formate antiporter-like isoform X2 n=1 Tax=Littorina saxatilis TaxID=31220 RepID=UPI0038B602CC